MSEPAEVDNRSAIERTIVAAGLFELLRDRWQQPEFASFVEMADTTGGAGRRIDFFAVSCWASKGGKGHSIAVEVKASRGDFMRELKEPGKREFATKVANECWFAVERGVVKDPTEVPEGWGLLERTAAGLVVRRAAQQRKIDPWPWSFVASFARRVTDPPPKFPKAVYRHAGRELDDETLVALGKELASADIAAAAHKANLAGYAQCEKAHAEDIAIARAVRERFGWRVKAADLPALLASTAISERDAGNVRARLNELTDEINRVLPKVGA